MRILALRTEKVTANKIMIQIKDDQGNPKCSENTIRNRLHEFGLFGRRRRKKPLLKKQHKAARLMWAKAHRDWTVSDWSKVLWTDESAFQLFPGGEQYVWRKKGEEFKRGELAPTVKHGGGSVMIWGCFHHTGVGVLKRVEGTIDAQAYKQILIHRAMPELKALIDKEPSHVAWLFQHDNARVHTAGVVTQYLESKEAAWEGRLQVMDWPSQSPDLNPIENLWGYIKKKLRKRTNKPSSFNQLFDFILEEWNAVPSQILVNLIESMPRRIEAVIKNKGGSTKF